MARPSAELDAFAAVAAPRRRRILEVLGNRKMIVTQLVDELHWPQPMVSKHLAILRQAGVVRVERRQRQKVYEMEPSALKTIHDWTQKFEQMWQSQLDRIKARAEAKARGEISQNHSPKEKP